VFIHDDCIYYSIRLRRPQSTGKTPKGRLKKGSAKGTPLAGGLGVSRRGDSRIAPTLSERGTQEGERSRHTPAFSHPSQERKNGFPQSSSCGEGNKSEPLLLGKDIDGKGNAHGQRKGAKNPSRIFGPFSQSPRAELFREAALAFADAEHLGATGRANTLSRRFAVLHLDALRILDLLLRSTLHAIGFHRSLLFA